MESRSKKSIRNIISGIVYQIVAILINIISRRVFINYFGIEVLGVNGILSNVISMLSLTELGVGIAISQSLYKPLAIDDKEMVNSIMSLFKKIYNIVAFLILGLGLIIIPFLDLFVNTELSKRFVIIVFLLILADTVASYFLGYFQNLLIADQKKYYVNNTLMIFNLSLNVIQIIATIFTSNYFLFLVLKLIFDVIQNVMIYSYVRRTYAYLTLKNTKPLPSEYIKKLKQNVSGLMVANISTYLIFSTDNLILSVLCGATVVGLYSNYSMIIRAIKNVLSQIFQGITASFGNLLVLEDNNRALEIFSRIFFLNFWLCTFAMVSLFVLLNPFIDIWIGKEYKFSTLIVFVLCWNFYSDTMRSSIELVRNAAGLYSPYRFFKYWSVLEAVINLIVSIVLGKIVGEIGVFIGTAVSAVISCYVIPWNVYKYVFNSKSGGFYKRYFVYQFISLLAVFATYYIANLFIFNSLLMTLVIRILICLFVPNIVIVLFCYRMNECQFLWVKAWSLVKK